MKRLTLRLFATLRERVKTAELSREFPDGMTVSEVWERLVEEFPQLSGDRGAVRFAVNHEYVDADFCPRDNDQVAIIPPVSGGSQPPWVGPVTLGPDPIDVEAVERAVRTPAAGAIVTFTGVTRQENAGRRVIELEYEAYEPMALGEMRKIASRAGERFAITRIAIHHRVGCLRVGETSVVICVSAAHRAQAFDACRFAIDRLKEIVPIWKKERFEGGELWVGCQTSNPPPLR